MERIKLWDLPTRLFHWLLVAAIGSAYVTGEIGGNWLFLHGRIALFIGGLIAFRLVWGLVGSTYARFSQFVRGPAAIRDYLKGAWHGVGHNPLGALSVLALLGLVSLQLATGLFAYSDDIGFGGPFHRLISEANSELITGIHHELFEVLMVLIGVHVGAVMFYTHVKKDNLITPMITGEKVVAQGTSAKGGSLLAFVLAIGIAAGVVYGLSGAWLPPAPAAPPPASAPAW